MGSSDMINDREIIFPILVPLQYAAIAYMAALIVTGAILNITAVVSLIQTVKVSFVILIKVTFALNLSYI